VFIPIRDDNPRESFPVVTVALIAINTLVHIYQATMGPERAEIFIKATGVIPLEITTLTDIVRWPDQPEALLPIPLTLVTSIFVHGDWLHLISNMWYLWLFGDNVEDSMGHVRYVVFYLLCGLAAAGAQIAVGPNSIIPMVGASGAIAGVLGGYALQYPRARVHCLLFIVIIIQIVVIPAFVVLGLWFVLQLVRGFAAESISSVAWFAHIGGFLAGLALIKLFARSRGPGDPGPGGRENRHRSRA
jgi:membrane associated rhomboid family serine protease